MNSVIGAVIIVLIVGVIWYIWHRITSWRGRIQEETHEAQSTLHNMFDVLRGDITEQFDGLKKIRSKKRLIEEEERVQKHIEEGLDVAERFAQKEIEDIEKEVE